MVEALACCLKIPNHFLNHNWLVTWEEQRQSTTQEMLNILTLWMWGNITSKTKSSKRSSPPFLGFRLRNMRILALINWRPEKKSFKLKIWIRFIGFHHLNLFYMLSKIQLNIPTLTVPCTLVNSRDIIDEAHAKQSIRCYYQPSYLIPT